MTQNTVVPSNKEDPYDLVTLKGFLQRPYNVIEKDWASSDEFSAKLIDLSIPDALFNIRPIARKLANFRYFRAGLRIGVRINGTKFHYGKLLACWRPSHKNSGMDPANDNVLHASCYPHAIMSATENQVTELIVPYCLPSKYIDMKYPERYEMGALQIYVLNPLHIGNEVPPNVSVSVFLNFENVEFAGLSAYVLLPKAQGAVKEAVQKSSRGIISGVSEGVSTVAGAIKTIPIFSGSAGLVERIANSIGTLARSYGFCKPSDLTNWAPRILRNWNLSHSHGLENAPMLGLDPGNMISPAYDIVGSHPDEMRLDHLFRTPSLIETFLWKDDTKYFALDVHPMYNFTKDGVDADGRQGTIFYPTVLSWAAMPFLYWRGSLKYCIQVTASAFHSGRLRISWEPDEIASVDPGDVYMNDGANRVNHVMDIQTETEYYLTVPYLHAEPWLTTADKIKSNGKLYIETINHITHPEKPVPPIYINIWIAGGDDFQVAYATQTFLGRDLYASVKAQGLTRDQMRDNSYDPILKEAQYSIDDHITMGEIVTHVKDVIARPSPLMDIPLTKTDATYVNTVNAAYLIPNFPVIGSMARSDIDRNFRTYLTHYMALFRYIRGSITYKVITRDGSRTTQNGATIVNGGPLKIQSGSIQPARITQNDARPISVINLTGNTGRTIVNMQQSSNLEGTIPFYSRFYSYITSYKKGVVFANSMPAAKVSIFTEAYATTKENLFLPPVATVYHSAADDLILGFQVGPPALFEPKITYGLCNDENTRVNLEKNYDSLWEI